MTEPGGYFITGTDTGVGKTVATAALAAALQQIGRRVVPFKPVQTGWTPDGGLTADAEFVARVIESDEPLDAICPYRLPDPLAPNLAARRAGVTIDLDHLAERWSALSKRHEVVLVEGAGGLLVSITDAITVAGLAAQLALPLVIVIRPGLGTLNQTCLAVEAARRRGLTIAGYLISGFPATPDLATRLNPIELGRLLPDIPLIGVLPHDPDIDTERGRIGRITTWCRAAVSPLFGGYFSTEDFYASLQPTE